MGEGENLVCIKEQSMNRQTEQRTLEGFLMERPGYRATARNPHTEKVFEFLKSHVDGLVMGINKYNGCALKGVMDELDALLRENQLPTEKAQGEFHQMIGSMVRYILAPLNYEPIPKSSSAMPSGYLIKSATRYRVKQR